MLTIITNLILALRYWLQVRATTADYDLTIRIENDCREIEASIDALRARGDAAAQLTADQLRERLIRRQGFAFAVSAARVAPVGGPASADQGRPVQPTGG